MAAPKGNQYAAKPRLFDQALRRAIAADDYKRLHRMCEKLTELAAEGEPWAVQMVADRLDGKAKQQVELSGDQDSPLVAEVVWRVISKPDGNSGS